MDGSEKVAASIVGTAFLLALLFIGYHEFERQRDIAEAKALIQQAGDTFATGLDQASRAVSAVDARRRRAAAHADLGRREAALYALSQRRLATNQRCVGGVVVQVEGSTYTQLGSIQNPVHCAGDLADVPIR